MNKSEILNKYTKPEDKLLISKLIDKIEATNKMNKITYTDFLNLNEKNIILKLLKKENINYIFYGGYEGAEREVCIIYPEKFSKDIVLQNVKSEIKIIRIILPTMLKGKYIHKDYLGGLMKLGIKREKLGDIIVNENGADIIVKNEMTVFLENEIKHLTRFSKSKITVENIEDINIIEKEFKELEVIISSLRLDCVVSELVKTSRSKANEIIKEQRIFVNYAEEENNSRTLKEGDILTIRGKGKFIIDKSLGYTKKNRIILRILQY